MAAENTQIDHNLSDSLPGLPTGAVILDITHEDVDAFIAFDDKSYFDSDTPPDHAPPHFTTGEVREGLERGDVIRGIYGSDGELLAISWFQPEEEDKNMYVFRLDVSPRLRDEGVGTYFLDQAEQEARQRGYHTCSLHVDPLNSRGLYLYLKQGYRVEEYETDTEHRLQDWVFMRKHLTPKYGTLEAVQTVEAGDEAELRRTLELGRIGTGVLLSGDQDPRHNKIVFSVRA